MEHARLKLTLGGLVLIGAVAYLAVAGVRSGWVYYLEVDQFLAGQQYQSQRVRLCGRVAEEDFAAHRGRFAADFILLGKTQRIPVVYSALIPDTFKPGVDLVLEGKLDDAGVFQADYMMTKCASKYQAEEHAQRLETDE